jgi:hypothetical protein
MPHHDLSRICRTRSFQTSIAVLVVIFEKFQRRRNCPGICHAEGVLRRVCPGVARHWGFGLGAKMLSIDGLGGPPGWIAVPDSDFLLDVITFLPSIVFISVLMFTGGGY